MKESIMQSAADIRIAADIATVITAIATVVATIGGLLLLLATVRQLKVAARELHLNKRQLSLSRDVQEADFWLQLRQMFEAREEVHHNLVPGGDWWDPEAPISPKKDDEEEEDDRFEVTWAKDKIVSEGPNPQKKDEDEPEEEEEEKYVVPWTGNEQAMTVNDLRAAFDALRGPIDHPNWRGRRLHGLVRTLRGDA
jgi:hypothetical protein